jgi:hypothetical protein
MKKLIELGHTESIVMGKILKEEWVFYPKKAVKFTIEKVSEDDSYPKYYLSVKGKLDIDFFGCLMYKLGMQMNIK